jgi:putative peptidoglycan lipid II flippase
VKSFLGNLSVVSGATLASRILGLLRDILFFSTFGASIIGEAFLLAFTIPNLFRRMLGEGTLNSAFVPVFSKAWHKFGKERAWAVLNQIISRMFFYLGGFVVMIAAVSWLVTSFSPNCYPKWNLAGQLNTITFGYLTLICTSAILVGVLNLRGHFWEGAISPVILNTCMILCLVLSHNLFGGNLWITALRN